MTFTFVGMPASGKSCIGRALSKRLNMKLIDADRVIEAREGRKLQEIIDQDGLEAFKRIEEETILTINDDNVLLAPGGSAIYYPRCIEHFKKLGKIIYLHCSYDVIAKRLGDYSKRGVVLRPDQTLFDLYQERCALYEKYADIVIDCSGNDYPTYQKRAYYAIMGTLGNI